MNKHKRQYRELSDETKRKISQALTGRKFTIQHRNRIAEGLKKYWTTIKSKHEIE